MKYFEGISPLVRRRTGKRLVNCRPAGKSVVNSVLSLIAAPFIAFGSIAVTSGNALAQVSCEGGHDSAVCRLSLMPGLALETQVAAMQELASDQYKINGNASVVAQGVRIQLNDASLTVNLGDSPEIYGETEVPLDQVGIFQDAVFEKIPRAAVGLVNGASIPELTGEALPLNDGYSEGGTLRDAKKPYLLFHLHAGVSFSLDFGEGMDALNSVVFSIPGSLKATAVMDIFDPYLYLAYSKVDGIDLNNIKKKPSQNDDGLVVYEIRDENDEHVVMAFTLDPETGVLLEQNFIDNTQVYYERDVEGNYVQQNVASNPAVLDGSQFDDSPRRKPDDEKTPESGDKEKASDLIDAIGFSANGWIPFKAETTNVMPVDIADFSGQFYLHGSIPMTNFLTLDGEVVTYIGEYGVAQGGNGNVSLGIPGLPDFIDFDIELGQATAAYKVTASDQLTYVSGILKPDTAFLEDYLPIMPSSEATVEGYIGDDIQNTMLTIKGESSLGAATLGNWIGLNLSDLAMTQSTMTINGSGVEISGVSRMQISPDIQVNSDISVYAQLSWQNPEALTLRLTGNMDIFGVALEDVTLQIGSSGMMVNGAFVTPATRIAMAGSIDASGPQLSGSGAINLDMGAITGTMQDTYATLEAAQAEVQRLQASIDAARATVQRERDRNQASLQAAQSEVDAAKRTIANLQNSIASHYRSISARRAQIQYWYNWYKQAKWHQKAGRYSRYLAEKSWRNADIGRHYASIATLKTSKLAAEGVLSAAIAALELVKNGMDLTPIDLDPRVAALITAKEAANVALEVAKQPFKNVPYINADLAGNLTLDLGVRGLSGEVSASVSGYSILRGELELIPRLRACIDVPTFGNACTAL